MKVARRFQGVDLTTNRNVQKGAELPFRLAKSIILTDISGAVQQTIGARGVTYSLNNGPKKILTHILSKRYPFPTTRDKDEWKLSGHAKLILAYQRVLLIILFRKFQPSELLKARNLDASIYTPFRTPFHITSPVLPEAQISFLGF